MIDHDEKHGQYPHYLKITFPLHHFLVLLFNIALPRLVGFHVQHILCSLCPLHLHEAQVGSNLITINSDDIVSKQYSPTSSLKDIFGNQVLGVLLAAFAGAGGKCYFCRAKLILERESI